MPGILPLLASALPCPSPQCCRDRLPWLQQLQQAGQVGSQLHRRQAWRLCHWLIWVWQLLPVA